MRESNLKGKRIKIIRLEDPYTDLRPGSEGTIIGEDDMGHILMKWDNGSSLSIIPEVDEYKIIENIENKRIFGFQKFLEFVKHSGYIDSKLNELEELIKSFSDREIIYEWENKSDHEVIITFQFNGDSIKFEFDIDDLYIVKTTNAEIDYQKDVDDTEEGLEIIEDEIKEIIGVFENIKIKNPNSLIINRIYKITYPNYDDYSEGTESEVEEIKVLRKDKFGYVVENTNDELIYHLSFHILTECEIEEILA